jgi:hypothetical protein
MTHTRRDKASKQRRREEAAERARARGQLSDTAQYLTLTERPGKAERELDRLTTDERIAKKRERTKKAKQKKYADLDQRLLQHLEEN